MNLSSPLPDIRNIKNQQEPEISEISIKISLRLKLSPKFKGTLRILI